MQRYPPGGNRGGQGVAGQGGAGLVGEGAVGDAADAGAPLPHDGHGAVAAVQHQPRYVLPRHVGQLPAEDVLQGDQPATPHSSASCARRCASLRSRPAQHDHCAFWSGKYVVRCFPQVSLPQRSRKESIQESGPWQGAKAPRAASRPVGPRPLAPMTLAVPASGLQALERSSNCCCSRSITGMPPREQTLGDAWQPLQRSAR